LARIGEDPVWWFPGWRESKNTDPTGIWHKCDMPYYYNDGVQVEAIDSTLVSYPM
jgi:hypothetical protein